MKQCIYCKENKKLNDYYSRSHKACKYCFKIKSRLSHLKGNPNTFSYADFELVRMKFGISKGEIHQYHLDHFIPKAWNHGGSHLGNLYLIKGYYNDIKSKGNPFIAFEKIGKVHPQFLNEADQIIEHITQMNGLTIPELISFVSWCETNKRNKIDTSKTSLELWRETL